MQWSNMQGLILHFFNEIWCDLFLFLGFLMQSFEVGYNYDKGSD